MSKAEAAGPDIRRALLAAGKQLAERGEKGISAESVSAEAGLQGASLGQHFQTLSHYLGCLVEAILDELRDEITAETAKLPQGLARVQRSMESYLEGNLCRPHLRSLMATHRFDPVVAEVSRRRTYGYGMLMNMEFAGIGTPFPAAAGRLCAVMAVETAIAEHEAGRRLPDMREALYAFLWQLRKQ
jgi:AcrR family transcriptional regulator